MPTGPRSISRSASVLGVDPVRDRRPGRRGAPRRHPRRAIIRSVASGFPLGTFSKELERPRAGARPARLDLRAGRSVRGDPARPRRPDASGTDGPRSLHGRRRDRDDRDRLPARLGDEPPRLADGRRRSLDGLPGVGRPRRQGLVRGPRQPAVDAVPMTGERILVVDDHAGFRATARRLARGGGLDRRRRGGRWRVGLRRRREPPTRCRAARHRAPGHRRLRRRRADGGRRRARRRPRVEPRSGAPTPARIATSVAIGFIAKEDLDGGRPARAARRRRGR